MRIKLGVLALVAALTLCGCEKDNTPVPNALTKYPFSVQPKILWKTHASSGSGQGTTLGLFEMEHQLVTVGHEGSVALIDKASGHVLWKTNIHHEISARAVADNGRIFVPTRDGWVIALNVSDGKPLWSQTLSSLSLAGVSVKSGLLVVNEHNGNVSALDVTSGLKLWMYMGTTPPLELQGSSEPVENASMAYVGSNQGQVFAFDLQSGVVKWNRPIAIPNGSTMILRMIDINSTPILGETALYAVAYHGNLVSLNPFSGNILWERPFSAYQSLAADLSKNAVFLTDEKSDVFKIDSTQGATLWKQNALEYRNLSAPTVFGDHLLLGDYQGYLHSLSISNGQLEGRIHVESSAILAQGVSDQHAAYFVTRSGEVIAITL